MATSIVIYKRTPDTFSVSADGVPVDEVISAYYSGNAIGDNVSIKSNTGAIFFKDINYQYVQYIDDVTPANSVTAFTSPLEVIDTLKVAGFFDISSDSGSGGVTAFPELNDTFNYAGRNNQVVIVNNSATRLTTKEVTFVENFTDLNDTPDNLVANKYPKVNAAGTEIIWVDGIEGNQNNIGRKINVSTNDPSQPTTAKEVRNRMNATTILINETETPVIVYIVKLVGSISRVYPFFFMAGAGVYGDLGTPVTTEMLFPLPVSYLTPEDIESDPNATVYNLGNIPDGDYVSVANEAFYDFSNSGDDGTDGGVVSYYFSFTQDGVLYYALFVGEQGTYGDGATPFVESDFIDTTNSGVDPSDVISIDTYKSIIREASVSNIRNDQPSFVTLDNGNILCAFGYFGASGSDSSTAYIAGSISTDGGKTWGTSFPLQTNVSGALSTRTPSLYKRPDGKILMMYNVLLTPVPSPTSKIYKTVFNQDLTVFQAASDIGLATGYYPAGSDRLYYDSPNATLLLPTSVLVSGIGTSYESLYKGTILKSTDQGQTWIDLNLSIGLTKIILNNIGGAIELGVFYSTQGLTAYFRSLQGYTWGVKLDASYAPTGSEYQLYSAANAQSSIKYISSKGLIVAACTRLTNNNPIGDNYRKYIDVLTSEDGLHFSKLDEIDFAIQTTDYYVNQPIVHEYKETVLIGYSISRIGALTASLLCKIYPKSFIQYNYKGDYFNGISDDGKGRIYNGIQEINSIDNTRNFVSLRNPKGGYYSSLVSSVTGAIKISLPNNKNSYITLRGSIYENSSDKGLSFEIYCNSSNMAINTVIVKGYELNKDLNFRFVDGSTPVIFIGNLATTWVYPQVVIHEVSAGFNSYLNELAENWKIAFETGTYGTVVSTKNQINSSNVRNATLSVYDAPAGINLQLIRGTFGTRFGISSTIDGYIAYAHSTATALYRIFGDTGNFLIGSSIGTDSTFKLDVQGTFRASGTATHAAATLPTESALLSQVNAKVTDAIVDGVTTVAPSQNAVFDALALKAPISAINNSIGTTYSILATDDIIESLNTSATTVTLPTAVGITGKRYIIRKGAVGQVTINTTSSQLIDNFSNYILVVTDSAIEVVSNGLNWRIIRTYNTSNTVNTTYTTARTTTTLNNDYGNCKPPFTVFAPNVGSGKVYVKYASSGTNQWMEYTGILI